MNHKEKIFPSEKEKNAFISEMSLRFSVLRNLMETLETEIKDDSDIKKEAKTIFCAFKLMMHLDNFVEEFHSFINEDEEKYVSILSERTLQ